MLVEDAQRIADTIHKLGGKREIAKSIEGFQTRVEMLEQSLLILNPLATVLREFQKHEIAVDVEDCSPTAQLLKRNAIDVAARFEEDPESILGSDEKLRHQFWELLEGKEFPSTVKRTLLKAWQDHVDALIPPHKPDLLDTLALVPALESDANTIRQFYADVSELRKKLPQSTADLQRSEGISEQLDSLWQRFGDDVIPEDVLRFLRSASSPNGARLSQLTPTVKNWLERHELERSIRILL